ncbi:DUF4369 domain-containing protein [Marinifilum sp.]|uniref:DUF4369 domain-containing protein n=1 Tax=Marinifilum sp. TaxID=2033137 RepID=UPI003BA8764D
MNNKSLIFICAVLVASLWGCKQTTKKEEGKQFALSAEIKGKENGWVYISSFPCVSDAAEYKSSTSMMDSVMIENGKFEYHCDLKIPSTVQIFLDKPKDKRKKNKVLHLFATNETIHLEVSMDNLENAKFEGDHYNKEYKAYKEGLKKCENVPGYKEHKEKYSKLSYEQIRSLPTDKYKKWKDDGAEFNRLVFKKQFQFKEDYLKENPKSLLSLVLVNELATNKSAEYFDKMLGHIDNETLGHHPIYLFYSRKIEKMRGTEVGFNELFKGIANVNYQVDKSFKGKKLKDIIYLGSFANNNTCAITKDAAVQIISPQAKILSSFETKIEGKPSSVAVDQDEKIYVLYSIFEVKEIKRRGKKFKVEKPKEARCRVFNTNGEKITDYKLEGLLTPTGAKVAGAKLLVSDSKQKAVGIFNSQSGEKLSAIEDLRSCCGIMDIDVKDNNQILVANLGAFRVSGYDLNGVKNLDFGQRGNVLNDFHGCCNPVSVAYLSNGAIVTVEKSPTRVKIYSRDGAKVISGIHELVQGCDHIPMTVDNNDNVYLASPDRGMIRCIKSI